MASGIILGDCPVCDELVYEDEWSGSAFERWGKFIHVGDCVTKYHTYTRERAIIRKQAKEIKELRQEIERLTLDNSSLLKGEGKG